MSQRRIELTLTVNGQRHEVAVEPRKTLADTLREDCGLDRDPSRLRARRVRCLHCPGRR